MEHVGAKRGVRIGLIRAPFGSREWMYSMVDLVAWIESSADASL